MTRRRLALAVWLFVMAGGPRADTLVRAAEAASPWGTLEIPGGYEALQRAVRLSGLADEWRTLPLIIEMSFAGPEGLRHTRAIHTYAEGLRREPASTTSMAPLPLGARFWEARFDPVPPPRELVWAILASRDMSALYFGLMSLDDGTLRAIEADPALTRALVRHARALPTVASALRIDGGRVQPPGGDATAQLWERLVGERLDRPAQFVSRLLGNDGGRLAYFYATVTSLPAEMATFVTGGLVGPVRERSGAFQRVYASFERALAGWQADALVQPPPGGPAEVLFSLTARADGALDGPPWEAFWRRAFASDEWPTDAAHALGDIDPHVLDAARLLEVVCPGICDERRLATVALVQRQFPDADLRLAPALLAVARTRLRYPALALELERMALGDVALFAQLGMLASRIDRLDQPAAAIALVQFQSAVAFLARLRSVGAPASMVHQHAASLAALPIGPDGFDGSLLRWLVSWPTSVLTSADGHDPDALAERALAGSAWQTRGVRLEWEGEAYRVDIAITEQARLRAARSRFASNGLTPAVQVLQMADDLPEAVRLGRAPQLFASAADVLSRVREPGEVTWTGERTEIQRVKDVSGRLSSLLRGIKPSDRRRLEQAVRLLRRTADLIAADALAGLVYAMALQNSESGLAMSRELPRRHRLGEPARSAGRASPWDVPVLIEPQAGSRSISGSLLALDAGITELGVQRMRAERPVQEPNMSSRLATGLWRTAALHKPWTIEPDAVAAVAAARASGLAIAARWAGGALDDRELVQAGIAGPRAGWLRWLLARGEAAAPVLSLEDAVRLGGWSGASRRSMGAAALPSLCLCVLIPRGSWEVRGRPAHPEAAAGTIVEPLLRVAIELHDHALPSVLAPGVLALLTTDVIEQSALPHPLDAAGVVEAARRVPSRRFDDYIAAVAARGPLVPVDGQGGER